MNKNKRANECKRICIVALGAYPLLKGIKTKNIIGPDVHQVILAKKFVENGFNVSIIAYGQEGMPIEFINKIKVIKIKCANNYFSILNILVKSIRIFNAMYKANAHIYFQAGGIPCIVSIFCKLMGRKYVYENASDALVDRKLVNKKIGQFSRSMLSIQAIGYWFDINLADAIIVQNKNQMRMLQKNFNREGILINISIPLQKKYEKVDPPIVLWVGSVADVKQPELFVNLAKAIPSARFQMIGGHSSNQEELYNIIKKSAKNVSNLELIGVVPFDEIDEYFGRSSILVNTSMFEGFPNAFIQAWMHCVPVISLNADPNELICKKKIGFHSSTFEQMVIDLKKLISDREMRLEMGENGRRYIESNHDINEIILEYKMVFNGVMEK